MIKGGRMMTSTQRMFWMQKYMQSSLVSQSMRGFGAAAHHGHDDHHDDHHGHDDHHHHVEKADGDHKFITSEGSNKRFLFFNGLKATAPATVVIENPYRHHNDLPLVK